MQDLRTKIHFFDFIENYYPELKKFKCINQD